MNKITIMAIFSLLVVTACKDDKVGESEDDRKEKEAFILRNVCGVYEADTAVFTYVAADHQIALSTKPVNFRIQSDNQNVVLNIALSSAPVLDETIQIVVTTVNIPKILSGQYNVKVLKTTEKYAWLWDAKTSIGFIIRTS